MLLFVDTTIKSSIFCVRNLEMSEIFSNFVPDLSKRIMSFLHIKYLKLLIISVLTQTFAVALLTSCSDGSETLELEVIYTTDVHGSLLPYDFLKQHAEESSMAKVSSFLQQERATMGDNIILLDNGDMLQGDPSMYYFNYEAIREVHLAARIYNYLGYDAVNIGNHDFESGEIIYRDHLPKQMDAQLLGANCIDIRTGQPMFKPYTIVRKGNFKIAILGITTPDVTQWLPKQMYPHLRFETMTETAQMWVRRIRSHEDPDLLIVMFHAGDENPERTTSHGEKILDGVSAVLDAVDGIDIALIGHDHEIRTDVIVTRHGNQIPVLQPAPHAQQIGAIKVTLTRKLGRNTDVKFSDERLIDTRELEQDDDFYNNFEDAIVNINKYLDKPLGQLNEDLDGVSSLVNQSSLMDFIHEVQLNTAKADISFASALSVFDTIRSGDVTMRQLFRMYKYENQIDKFWMLGKEVKQFLEWGAGQQYNQMKNEDDYVLSFQRDSLGNPIMTNFGPKLATPQYNFTSAAGIDYTIDISKPTGSRVTIHSMADGSKFDPEHRYIVVMSSYQASGGGGFISGGLGWNAEEVRYHTISETSKDIRHYIARYIVRQNGIVQIGDNGHWNVVPANWVSKNKKRDIEMLLPYIRK